MRLKPVKKKNNDNDLMMQKKRAVLNRREKRDKMSGKSSFDYSNPVRALNDNGLLMTLRNEGKKCNQYVYNANRSTGCDRQIRVNQFGMMVESGSHNED